MKPAVAVTEKEFLKARPLFEADPSFACFAAPLEEDRLAAAIRKHGAVAAILGVDPYRDALYAALPRGGVLARFGVGHDGIDKALATVRGLLATNTPGVLDDSVAEHAILLLGGLLRRIAACHGTMTQSLWQPEIGSELKDKTLLVLGCGPIGRKTARIASFGFSMRVIGYDTARLDGARLKEEFGIHALVPRLDEALAVADAISLHLPATPQTRHFVNAEFLRRLRPSCVLVNTARGPIVDESALFDALARGALAGAALDVFENEPFRPADPGRDLRALDRVLLTPHIGSSTVEACHRMAARCLADIRAARERRYGDMALLNPGVLDVLKEG